MFLLFLTFESLQTLPHFKETRVVLAGLDLVNHVECVCQDRKNNIEKEEGADYNERNTKDDRHPPDVRIHEKVHYSGPLLEGYHLEDSQHSPAEVIKSKQVVENHLLIDRHVDLWRNASIHRLLAKAVSRAFHQPLTVWTAEEFEVLVDGPGAIGQRLLSKAAPIVHRTRELLYAKDAEQREDEEHENDCIQ